MSSSDPPRESSSAVALNSNNDTLITIQQSSVSLDDAPVATAAVVAPSNPPTSDPPEEVNSSIGSQRSLNSRLFPFRITRDSLWNNVSFLFVWLPMTHCLCFVRCSKKFVRSCKILARPTLHSLHGCAVPSRPTRKIQLKQKVPELTSKREQKMSL